MRDKLSQLEQEIQQTVSDKVEELESQLRDHAESQLSMVKVAEPKTSSSSSSYYAKGVLSGLVIAGISLAVFKRNKDDDAFAINSTDSLL